MNLRLTIPLMLLISSCSFNKEQNFNFKTGKFIVVDSTYNIHLHYFRNDSIQIETDVISGQEHFFKIDWINDDKYKLTPLEKDSLTPIENTSYAYVTIKEKI